MKKLLSFCALLMLSSSGFADNWKYEYLKSDFGDDTKVVSINDSTGQFELAITSKPEAVGDDRNVIAFLLPRGFVTSSDCKSVCYAKINVDGNKDIEPIKLLEARSFKMYFVYGESKKRFLDYLQNNKVVKVQLPLHRELIGLTYNISQPLDINRLDNLKPTK